MDISHKHNILILSCKNALILFPTWGSNLCLLTLQADSLLLTHQGNKKSFHLSSSILHPPQPVKGMRGVTKVNDVPLVVLQPG